MNIKYLLIGSVIGVVVIALTIALFFLAAKEQESVANTFFHQTLSEKSQPVPKEIRWDALIPEGYRPDNILAKYQSRIDSLQDDSKES